MTPQIEIGTEGRLGTIALNRPEAINALSLDMIAGITAQLNAWRDDPAIRAVLFEGLGPRGFCSGGDVRAARKLVLDGRPDEADAYFAAEYRMNGLIATYAKPVVAIADRIVMGGGIGIAGHARFRSPRDCNTHPRGRSGSWPMSGQLDPRQGAGAPGAAVPIDRAAGQSADVLALGLADSASRCRGWPSARRDRQCSQYGDIEPALVALMQASIQAGERDLCDLADELVNTCRCRRRPKWSQRWRRGA